MSDRRRDWQEIGDRVYRMRYRSLDLNVGVVVGDDEVLVIDTRSFAAEAAELLADLRRLTRLPCRKMVNTHWHFDHCYGNATLRPAAIWGHQRCAAQLRGQGEVDFPPGGGHRGYAAMVDGSGLMAACCCSHSIGGR